MNTPAGLMNRINPPRAVLLFLTRPSHPQPTHPQRLSPHHPALRTRAETTQRLRLSVKAPVRPPWRGAAEESPAPAAPLTRGCRQEQRQ